MLMSSVKCVSILYLFKWHVVKSNYVMQIQIIHYCNKIKTYTHIYVYLKCRNWIESCELEVFARRASSTSYLFLPGVETHCRRSVPKTKVDTAKLQL